MLNKTHSVNDFKKWLSSQKDLSEFFSIDTNDQENSEELIGVQVVSKVNEKKLLRRIETDDDPETLVKEFLEEGGSVVAVDEQMIEIEVSSGSLTLPKFYVKVRRD